MRLGSTSGQRLEHLIGDQQVSSPRSDRQPGLDGAVVVGAAGGHQIVPGSQLSQDTALLGPVGGVVGLDPAETGSGELANCSVELVGRQVQGERVGQDTNG